MSHARKNNNREIVYCFISVHNGKGAYIFFNEKSKYNDKMISL